MRSKETAIGKYITKDFNTMVVLYACDIQIKHKFWQNGKCYLAFDNPEKCQDIMLDHVNGKLEISTKKILHATQEIRSIINQKDQLKET